MLRGCFRQRFAKEECVMRLFGLMLALALASSTQAVAFEPPHERDAMMTRNAEVDGGCGANHHRGVGGACVLNPTKGPYRPDPYWTPCDYSLGPQNPEGCAE
jgi:hypothetical protein